MEKVAHFFFDKTSRGSGINSNTVLLIGILFVAAFLRLFRIADYMTFLGDEGRDVLVVYDILHGKPTLLGPTASVGGFFLGPIYYYFMVPFLWIFNYSPVGPAVMVALFGIATVYLTYKVGSEFFGKTVGLIAAFLYSISPLTIAYSRSSWNPNLMPFFSLLSLYVLYKAVERNSLKLFIFCGFLLGIAMQLHYLAFFLIVIVSLYILLTIMTASDAVTYTAQKKLWTLLKDYLYTFVGFVIGWSPFLLFEVRHGFPNIQSLLFFIFQSGDTGGGGHFPETIYNVFFRLFARLVTRFPPPEQVALGAHPNIALWYYATLILGIVSILFLIQKFIASLGNREQFQKTSLLALWLVIGVLLFGFYKKPIYDYYFGFMFPLPFMLVGVTISGLHTNAHESFDRLRTSFLFRKFTPSLSRGGHHELSRINMVGKILIVSIFIAIVWLNLQGIPFRFIPNRQLAQVEKISKFVIDKTGGRPFNFALITGGNSDHAYRYFFKIWNRDPVVIENVVNDPKRETVTNQLLVVCETPPCHPLGDPLWEVAGFGRGEIVGEWNVSVVKVYKLKHYVERNL